MGVHHSQNYTLYFPMFCSIKDVHNAQYITLHYKSNYYTYSKNIYFSIVSTLF